MAWVFAVWLADGVVDEDLVAGISDTQLLAGVAFAWCCGLVMAGTGNDESAANLFNQVFMLAMVRAGTIPPGVCVHSGQLAGGCLRNSGAVVLCVCRAVARRFRPLHLHVAWHSHHSAAVQSYLYAMVNHVVAVACMVVMLLRLLALASNEGRSQLISNHPQKAAQAWKRGLAAVVSKTLGKHEQGMQVRMWAATARV